MDTIQQPTPPPPPSYSSQTLSRGIFGTRIPSSIAFAVGILLFLLPFSEIKCNNSVIANKSGLGFVLGNDWKSAGNFGDKESTEGLTSKTNKEKEGNVQYFAIAALALGVLGLLLSFANTSSGGVVSGVLSAGALVGLMIELKKWFNASLAKDAMDQAQNNSDTLGMGNAFNNMKPTLNFTPWFYVAMIAFLLAAFFSYRRMSAKGKS